MAHVFEDRIAESTTTTGTGALTLAGALPGYKTFGSVMAAADTCWYALHGVDTLGNPTGVYEEGLGTWNTTLARTAVLRSSNSNAVVSLSAGTYYVYVAALAPKLLQLGPLGESLMPAVTANPASAPTDTLYFYARKLAGRMLPKWMPPSGVDNPVQPAFFGNRIVTFAPNTGTTGTGQGVGPAWTSNGTVSHPTPSSTSPAVSNQMKRTRYANVVTTTNQQLGPRFNVASERQFWRGNAAGLGGFFFVARFVVDLWAASTCRIFAGLTGASATASVCISDTVVNDTCGLWHDTTDSNAVFNFVTRNAATTTKQTISLSNNIAAGNSYDFYMYAMPNGSSISWRLDDLVNNVTYENNTSTTLPTNTVFMQPQVQMSNGTANTTVTTVAIGIAGIYVESDR